MTVVQRAFIMSDGEWITQVGLSAEPTLNAEPTGRSFQVAVGDLRVVGVLHGPRQLLDKMRPLRSRSNQAHFAAQHVGQLRQFIDAGATDEGADPGGAGILLLRPPRTTASLGIHRHAAELQ